MDQGYWVRCVREDGDALFVNLNRLVAIKSHARNDKGEELSHIYFSYATGGRAVVKGDPQQILNLPRIDAS